MLDQIFNTSSVFGLFLISVISFVLFICITIIGLFFYIKKLPEDYFIDVYKYSQTGTVWALFLNVLAVLLVISGLIMLVTPGQGVLTILLGLLVGRYPAKYRVIGWLKKNQRFRNSLDSIRLKVGRRPFLWDSDE